MEVQVNYNYLEMDQEEREREYLKMQISDEAFKDYSERVKYNWRESEGLRTKKLIRNFYCSNDIVRETDRYIVKAFGCLHIKFDKFTNCIIKIRNYKDDKRELNIDFDKKEFATKVLKIDELKLKEKSDIPQEELLHMNKETYDRFKMFNREYIPYARVRNALQWLVNTGEVIHNSDGKRVIKCTNGLMVSIWDSNFISHIEW